MAIKTYLEVYKEHSGFVSHKWIHYFFIYDRIFKRFLEKGKPIKMLEIGIQNGGSLEIWKKYLPHDSVIHGIDIDERCRQLKFSEGIFFHLGSATDESFIEKAFGDIQFDVILDDGSHICRDVIQTFEYLLPVMKNGGAYIVEDMHTSYWKEYGGGIFNQESPIEYFKKLIDLGINRDHIRYDLSGKNDYLEVIKNISQISFFDSICLIEKFYKPKETPFSNITVGEISLVAALPTQLNINTNEKQREINKTEKIICG